MKTAASHFTKFTKNPNPNSFMKSNTPTLPAIRVPSLRFILPGILLFLLALAPALCRADAYPPDRLTYQGYLTDANGTALATNAPKNYDLVFRVYSAATGGTALWTEQQTVTVDRGYFNVLLGEGTQVLPEAHDALSSLFVGGNASDRYVETTVKKIGSGNTDATISPRLRLLTSPYAYLAKYSMNANCLVNSNSVQVISVTGTNVTVPGTVTATTFDGGGTIPLGGIIMWSGSTAPTGWALCNGTNLNGWQTPNLSGRFVLASGSVTGLTSRVAGASGGEETHVLTTNEMPVHVHRFVTGPTNVTLVVNQYLPTQLPDAGAGGGYGYLMEDVPAVLPAGGGLAHTNLPPYYVLAYIMRVK